MRTRPAEALSSLQCRALAAVARHGAWRAGNGYFANYGNLVAAYGFLGTPEGFQAFVESLPS